MYTGQMVFSQLMDFLPKHEFNKCVRRYQGNYRVSKLSCLDQFLCMVFAQLTKKDGDNLICSFYLTQMYGFPS